MIGKNKTKRGNIAVVLLVVLIFLPATASAIGVGIAPANIVVSDILQGGFMQKHITVSNPEDYAETITMSTDPDCADWITFSPTQIEIGPKGEVPVEVDIQIPSNLGVGEHTCNIRASAAASSQGTGMGTVAASVATLRLTVTGEEKVNGEILRFWADDAYRGQMANFTARFVNLGNTNLDPVLEVTVIQGGKEVTKVTGTKTGVRPGEIMDILAQWDTIDAKLGEYTASAKVTFRTKTLTAGDGFEVIRLPEGVILEREVVVREGAGNQLLWIALILGICIILAAVVMRYKKPGTSSSKEQKE